MASVVFSVGSANGGGIDRPGAIDRSLVLQRFGALFDRLFGRFNDRFFLSPCGLGCLGAKVCACPHTVCVCVLVY
eukprot:11867878-Alexandrium_andersonii.AAC.1